MELVLISLNTHQPANKLTDQRIIRPTNRSIVIISIIVCKYKRKKNYDIRIEFTTLVSYYSFHLNLEFVLINRMLQVCINHTVFHLHDDLFFINMMT